MSEEKILVKFIIDQIWDDLFSEETDYDVDKMIEIFSKEVRRIVEENAE